VNIIDLNKKGWQWAVLLFLAFIWGSSFILMKNGLVVFSAIQVASLRISIAALVLLPFAIKYIRYLKTHFLFLLAVGFIGNGIPAYLFTWSQMHVSSSSAGILNSLTPVFTLIVGGIFFKTRVKKFQLIGVFLGLAGSVLLFVNKSFSFEFNIFTWGLLIVLATAMYGVNMNHVKTNLKEVPAIAITSLSFMLLLPVSLSIYFMNLPCPCIAEDPEFLKAVLSISALAVFGSAVAVATMNTFIKYTTPVFASSVTYIMPAVALAWGFNDNEDIGLSSFIALVLILAGVYLVQIKSDRKNVTE
jgi:drug/metabolite transporter (DMT)-like permease